MLSFLVHVQTTVQGKGHVTVFALQVFGLFVLGLDVVFQRLFVHECIVALGALICNALMFGPNMLDKFMFVAEGGFAMLAVKFDPSVLGLDVNIQCGL